MPTSEDGDSGEDAAETAARSFDPGNFPLRIAMNSKGDVAANWEFFSQQWSDYEVATKRKHSSRVAEVNNGQSSTKQENIDSRGRRESKTPLQRGPQSMKPLKKKIH